MTKIEIQEIVENLIDTFLYAGKISIELRKKGLIKEIKPVKQIINGEKINNKEAIANPESLRFFENLPQLKL